MPTPTHGRAQPRRLIKDFEREARTDGLPAEDLGARKRLLVAKLNAYITAKKEAAGALETRRELVADGRVNRAGAEIGPSSARPAVLLRMITESRQPPVLWCRACQAFSSHQGLGSGTHAVLHPCVHMSAQATVPWGRACAVLSGRERRCILCTGRCTLISSVFMGHGMTPGRPACRIRRTLYAVCCSLSRAVMAGDRKRWSAADRKRSSAADSKRSSAAWRQAWRRRS